MSLPPAPDPATLRPLLRRDPVSALYMLADLEPPWFDQCRWLIEAEDGASAVGPGAKKAQPRNPAATRDITRSPFLCSRLRRRMNRYPPGSPANQLRNSHEHDDERTVQRPET
jgi:hypothetical protein